LDEIFVDKSFEKTPRGDCFISDGTFEDLVAIVDDSLIFVDWLEFLCAYVDEPPCLRLGGVEGGAGWKELVSQSC